MTLSPMSKRVLLAAGALGLLGVLRFTPWRSSLPPWGGDGGTHGDRETLTVGFLPVT